VFESWHRPSTNQAVFRLIECVPVFRASERARPKKTRRSVWRGARVARQRRAQRPGAVSGLTAAIAALDARSSSGACFSECASGSAIAASTTYE